MKPLTENESCTQRHRLLTLLLSRSEVPLPEILDLGIAQYGTRILELRRLGFRITNRRERRGRKTYSYFRLEPSQPSPLPAAADAFTDRLFPDDAPSRHVDLG